MTKLLIVEDDELLDSAYKQKFVGLFDFKIASNVSEAKKELVEFKPDVILLDLYMPGKYNGIDFLEGIKKSELTKKIPVIVTTNLPDSVDKVIGMGAESCFMKSNIGLDKIIDEINRVVSMIK